ncbi:MAG: ABC transporter permease [Candidatus Aenigmatarchaeota archaeon]
MRLSDIVRLSLNNLSHRGLRSWLTILGIVIGVASVVSILSLSAGMQQSVSSRLGSLGADILTISLGSGRAFGMGFGGSPDFGGQTRAASSTAESQNLTTKDVAAIRSVQGVKYVNGIVSGRGTIAYLAESTSVTVEGVDTLTWPQMTTETLASGRLLSTGDQNAIVIGYSIANTMFKQPLTLNSQLSVGGTAFKIVGILAQSGSQTDRVVYMPAAAARTVVSDVRTDQFSSIQVKVADVGALNETMTAIEQRLIATRHVTASTKDFTITSVQAMQATISSVMDTMNLFLGGIAAISLLVGAIGIANTMFMSVMERTRQIGTLKALGTTSFEVMKLFLFESAMIGLIGGMLGLFLGFIASGLISELGIRMMGLGGTGGMSGTLITPQLMVFAVGFSVIIGAVSGILPARSAAGLQPIEALRYE